MTIFREPESKTPCFEFDFGDARAERFDEQGRPQAQGMMLVDFVVEEKGITFLIEVKDPAQAPDPITEQRKFIKTMKGETLINEALVPKARDSYCFLHLMERDANRLIFVVLLGLDAEPFESALLGPFKDKLLSRLRQETHTPWRRQYVSDCIVVTPDQWKSTFTDYSLNRISSD